MIPVNFEGAYTINKPPTMTDEECSAIWAKHGLIGLTAAMEEFKLNKVPPHYKDIDNENFLFFLTAWKPSFEDLEALNRGEPIYIKTLSQGLPPMSVFTLDKNGQIN